MHWLSVTLRFHDAVVEQRLCEVRDALVLGEGPDATVSFPGCRVVIRRVEGRLQLAGRWIDPGQRLEIRKDPVHLSLEAVTAPTARSMTASLPDPRLMVLSGAILLMGAWVETGLRVIEGHPEAVSRVASSVQRWAVPPGIDAAPRITVAQPGGAKGTRSEGADSVDDPGESDTSDAYGDGLRWPPTVYQERH